MEHIVADAVYYGATISLPKPARHHTILQSISVLMNIDALEAGREQGFITNTGRYVNRVEAYQIARSSGQLKEDTPTYPQLYSEDLW